MELLDRFVPTSLHGDPGALRRGRVLAGTSFAFALASAAGLGLRMAIDEHRPAAIAIAVTCAAAFTAAPWLLRLTGSLAAAGGLLIAALFVLILGSGFVVGGLDGPVLVAASLLPFVATFLLGRRAGALVTLLTLATLVLFALLPPWGLPDLSPTLAGLPEVLARAVMLALTTASAGFFAVLYEKQRAETEDNLRRSRDLYRRIFEQSRDIVALSTPGGDLVDINRAGLDFYGFRAKEEARSRSAAAAYADPGERRALLDRLEEQGYVHDYETTHRTPGGPRILRGTTSTVRDDSGSIQLLLAILRDVTEERLADDRRERMLGELSRKNEELEAFTYAISHDLKSPLATARGFLRRIAKEGRAGNFGNARQYLAPIDRAAVKMDRMLEDLLELSRIGRVELDLSEVSLSELAEEATELVAGRVRAAGAAVEVAPDLPRVRGDRKLLLAVFQNLVDNAVKFSASHPRPRVWVDWRNGDPTPVVTVRDNGIGIPPQYQDRVFGVFQQLDPEAGGTGIGLATVKRAIEVHGGRVWIESEGEGRGTTFCWTLPESRPAAAARPAPELFLAP